MTTPLGLRRSALKKVAGDCLTAVLVVGPRLVNSPEIRAHCLRVVELDLVPEVARAESV